MNYKFYDREIIPGRYLLIYISIGQELQSRALNNKAIKSEGLFYMYNNS